MTLPNNLDYVDLPAMVDCEACGAEDVPLDHDECPNCGVEL